VAVRAIFDGLTAKSRFKIADAMTIRTGAVQLTYVLVKK